MAARYSLPSDLWDTARLNTRLVRPAPLALQAGAACGYEGVWQMAVLGSGVEVRAGAGMAVLQARVLVAVDSSDVIIGLVPAQASVADNQYPGVAGAVGGGCGWGGSGAVCWTLPGPAPSDSDPVCFGQGDRVMVVLDCRAEPIVRLLVNGQPRLVHTLADTPTSTLTLCPAIALLGDECGGAACVELEPAGLRQGWDAPPPPLDPDMTSD